MEETVMVGEAIAGLSAIKTAFDLAKGLKDISDAANRNAAVIELQEKILTAQQAQAALVERISELEKQVANFEAWDTEKEKYELKPVGDHGIVYMLKPSARGTEPPHWLCPNCYEQRKKSYLQKAPIHGGLYVCQPCKTNITAHGGPKWLDN
jgi:hypothetical protein